MSNNLMNHPLATGNSQYGPFDPTGYYASTLFNANLFTSMHSPEHIVHDEPVPQEAPKWGEIIGYRAWKTDGRRLMSMVHGNVWEPGQIMEAHAPLQPHSSEIGVHAWRTFDQACDYAQGNSGYSVTSGDAVVVGEVALYGDVIEYEHGYRAQYAAVHAVHVLLNAGSHWHPMVTADDLVETLREEYGVGGEEREVPDPEEARRRRLAEWERQVRARFQAHHDPMDDLMARHMSGAEIFAQAAAMQGSVEIDPATWTGVTESADPNEKSPASDFMEPAYSYAMKSVAFAAALTGCIVVALVLLSLVAA